MQKGTVEALYPLSPMQQGMLFHTLRGGAGGLYFVQVSFTLEGELDAVAFRRAWQGLVDRHAVLRTLYVTEGKQPLQLVRKQVELPWHTEDWRGRTAGEQRGLVEAFLLEDRKRGFAVDQAPLTRCALFQLEAQRYHFTWSFHHSLIDGWCLPLLFKELFALYNGHREGRPPALPPPRPYRDYITWLMKQDARQAEAFWREELAGFTAPVPLMADRPAASSQGLNEEQELILSPEATAALKAFVRQHRLTANGVTQAAWALLLQRYGGGDDITFGSTVSGRPPSLPGVESMVGLFINTLPVRTLLRGEETVLSLLERLRDRQVEREAYAHTPLVEIQQWSEVPRELSLFESILVFENYPFDKSVEEGLQQLRIRDARSVEKNNFPLSLIAHLGTTLTLRLAYDPARFEPATIRQRLEHLRRLLEALIAHPQARISELSILSEEERPRVEAWSRGRQVPRAEQRLQELFESSAAQSPGRLAVREVVRAPGQAPRAEELTYGELEARANQLARHLQSLGVKPETRVGLLVRHSRDALVAILGVLKAGGAYVPIDPEHPIERINFTVADAGLSILLTQEELADRVPSTCPFVFNVDTNWPLLSGLDTTAPPCAATPGNLAYTLYTSGSTGRPSRCCARCATCARSARTRRPRGSRSSIASRSTS
jgi:hypothetical protein